MGNSTFDQPAKQTPVQEKESAGKSMPAPQFKLAAGAAMQKKDESKAAAPKEEATKLTANGSFQVTDLSAREHSLTIHDAKVTEGKGKQAKQVGTIDGTGHYELNFDGEVVSGNLEDLPHDKVTGVSISEKQGKKEIRSKTINKEIVSEGVVYFDDGAYKVKKGVLTRVADKKVAGTLTVVTGGEGGGKAISAIRYNYTDAAGNVQTGDLMDGNFGSKGRKEGDMDMAAGEGSLLQVGKMKRGGKQVNRWMGFGPKSGEWQTMAKVKKGWAMSGGSDLKKTLQRLQKEGKIKITDEQIDLMVGLSQVESSGELNVINSYDSDKMSSGFIQFTAAGSLQEWIAKAEPAFKAFGIELMRDKDDKVVSKTVKDKVKAPWLKGMKSADDLRNSVWALRFFEAGLDDDVIAAEVTSALEIADNILRYVDQKKPGAALYDKPVVKTLFLELFNNREAYLRPVTQSSQAKLSSGSTLQDLLAILRVDIMAIYKKNWKKHGNGDTEAAGEDKGRRVFDKVYDYFY